MWIVNLPIVHSAFFQKKVVVLEGMFFGLHPYNRIFRRGEVHNVWLYRLCTRYNTKL